MALTIQLQVKNDRLTARAEGFNAPIDTPLADLPPLKCLQADPFKHG